MVILLTLLQPKSLLLYRHVCLVTEKRYSDTLVRYKRKLLEWLKVNLMANNYYTDYAWTLVSKSIHFMIHYILVDINLTKAR